MNVRHTKPGRRSLIFPDINRSEISKRTGISQAQVSRILSAESSGSAKSLSAIATVLGVTVDDLIAGKIG